MHEPVLLVVNCAADASYGNRSLLETLYRDRFDRVAFAVSPTCPVDADYWNIVQSWSPPPDGPECICGNPAWGRHLALRHCFHPRLSDIARSAADFAFIVFTEDDCLWSPAIDAAAVRRRCSGLDALTPPIFFCSRQAQDWAWTHHATGYPAYDAAARDWSHEQLRHHWAAYGGQLLPDAERRPMFFGFSDCAVFRGSFLQRVARDFVRLQHVWHEVAIPSAVLYNSARLGKLNGLALWGQQRERPLVELLSLLGNHDFVHPIKLSRYEPQELVTAYRALPGA